MDDKEVISEEEIEEKDKDKDNKDRLVTGVWEVNK